MLKELFDNQLHFFQFSKTATQMTRFFIESCYGGQHSIHIKLLNESNTFILLLHAVGVISIH